jgi:histone acetyltransferase (RNA polymerase elongator complex component)
MPYRHRFSTPFPEPPQRGARIWPVFLPFSGCPRRCLFCSQEAQTGTGQRGIAQALDQAERELSRLWAAGRRRPLELAFYGGTFTALPQEDMDACLAFAARWRERGLAQGLRCSTRPDAVTPPLLEKLRRWGCHTVELGEQSFTDAALRAAHRGYTGQCAEDACRMVKEAGLGLGVQLLPGMPGHSDAAAREDIARCVAIGPAFTRLYPCLVLEGTGLAQLWRKGLYAPWELEPTVDFLAWACRELGAAGIAVIRMGLAEEPGLAEQVVAGPRHPDMGGMARGRALFAHIAEQLRLFRAAMPQGDLQSAPLLLYAPSRLQGQFWGHRAELVGAYAGLGLKKSAVQWWHMHFFMVQEKNLNGVSYEILARAGNHLSDD